LTVGYEIVYRGLTAKGDKTTCTVQRRAYFADATSVADRVRVARAAGLAGAALWTIGGEAAAQWPEVRDAVGTQKAKPGARQSGAVRIGAPGFVTNGQEASFTATVTVDGSPSGSGTATLQENPAGGGGWRDVATQRVRAGGRVVFKHTPRKSARYRVAVSQTGKRKAARSATALTRVRAAVSLKRSVAAFVGQQVRLSGGISPGKRGVLVRQQRLVEGKWVTQAKSVTGRDGAFGFRITPSVRNGSYTYRVVSARFPGYARGVSSTVTFRAR
jgi:hypothetical protein